MEIRFFVCLLGLFCFFEFVGRISPLADKALPNTFDDMPNAKTFTPTGFTFSKNDERKTTIKSHRRDPEDVHRFVKAKTFNPPASSDHSRAKSERSTKTTLNPFGAMFMEHFGVFRQVNKHLAKERNTSTAQTRRAAIRKRTTIAPGTTRKTTPGLAPAITPSSYTEDDYIHDFFTFLMEYPTNELALLLDAKQKCAQINADQAVNWVCDMRLLMSLRNREQKQRLCGVPAYGAKKRRRRDTSKVSSQPTTVGTTKAKAIDDLDKAKHATPTGDIHSRNNGRSTTNQAQPTRQPAGQSQHHRKRAKRDAQSDVSPPKIIYTAPTLADGEQLPDNFDLRTQWPPCAERIEKIYDQGNCGSCWAVASSMVLQDRLCISKLTMGIQPDGDIQLSAAYLLSCSGGAEDGVNGCNGGWPNLAMDYVAGNRIVTGSDYAEDAFCMPYPFDPTQNTTIPPQCANKCTNNLYNQSFDDDKRIIGNGSGLASSSIFSDNATEMIDRIKREIYLHGSVVTTMKAYYDLYLYTDGIYAPTYTDDMHLAGLHAVRIVGWGFDASKNQTFWTVANSWSKDWGKKGFFDILMGTCEVDSNVVDVLQIDGHTAGFQQT